MGCTGTATVETTDICYPYITGLAHNGDEICPYDDVVASVDDYQMMTYGHAYTLTFILFETDNLGGTTYYDSNATGTFTAPPPGDYTICAYNELTDCAPDPSPNTSNLDDLADVGTVMDGCYTYECSTLTVPEPFEFDLDNATYVPNNSTGTNVYATEICGGTPPYLLSNTSSGGFASFSLLPSPNPGCQNVQIVFANGVDWSVTVTDSHNCNDDDSVLGSDDVLDPFAILSIDGFTTENETGAGEKDGEVEVMISGGDDACGDYTFDWSGPSFIASNTDDPDGNSIEGLASGTYNLTVTDCDGNVQMGDIYVNRDSNRRRGRTKSKTALIETNGSLLVVSPNPFAEQTTIEFSTVKPEKVSIDVFTLNGQHIGNLFEGQTSDEELQSVSFKGDKLQAGTYLIRLLTESGEVQHQKVVLMR